MRHKKLSLDLFGDRLTLPDKGDGEADTEYRRMLHTLQNAMQGELTERQRDCLRMRYFEQMRVNDIADALGLSPGTVSVHIKKGRQRIGRVMRYSFGRLQERREPPSD